jgi:hypothetical protein
MLDHAFTITWCAPRNPAGSFEAADPFAATAVPPAAPAAAPHAQVVPAAATSSVAPIAPAAKTPAIAPATAPAENNK